MEIGAILGLLTAVSFALSNINVRRGTYRAGEAFTATFISIFIGVIFFTLLGLFTGDWKKLLSLPWQGFVQLGIAGIIHFVLGRRFSYSCFRLIGANRGNAIVRTQMLYPVALGIILLGEPLTIFLVVGVLGIAAGATLVSMEKGGFPGTTDIGIRLKGIFAGLLGAFFWGISGVLIKPMVEQIGSPHAAAFISYVAATIVMTGLLFGKRQREQLSRLRPGIFIPLIIGGLFAAIAQLLRYTALIYSPVSVVDTLISTAGIFIFCFSFLLNRKIEIFTFKVFFGLLLATGGTFLVVK